MPYFQTHLARILLMSSAAPPAQWKLFFWCVGWQADGTCVRDLPLWSAPVRKAALSGAWGEAIVLPWHSLTPLLLLFVAFFPFFFFDFLCFNPCLSKSVFFFFLIWKPICFGLHRSCLWCDGSCWKSPKEYLCSQLEVEAKLPPGPREVAALGDSCRHSGESNDP